MKIATFEVNLVDVGDLELASGRWGYAAGDVGGTGVIKVQASQG